MRAGAMWWAVMGLGFGPGTAGATVDLNHATAAQMEQELGLTRGEAISVIQHREQQPFQSPDELAMVDGIGPEASASLKGQVSATSDQPPKSTQPAKKKSGRKAKSAGKGRRTKKSSSTKKPTTSSRGTGSSSLAGYSRPGGRPVFGLARH